MQASKVLFFVMVLVAFIAGVLFSQQQAKLQAKQEAEEANQAQMEAAIAAAKPATVPSEKIEEVASLLPREMQDVRGNVQPISSYLKELNLINFWATWCAPCREEMPLFDAVYQVHSEQGFQVIGIAIDDLEPVDTFVQELGIRYPIVLAGEHGWDLLETTGNPMNLLPYTILIDRQGKVLEQKLGIIKEDEINKWIQKYN
jgi:thiol-disulfide isomerase/thioredoxin